VSRIVVEADRGLLHVAGHTFQCTIGRSGTCEADAKREGDGRTPLGQWPICAALLRRDAGFTPPADLPWRWLRSDDGWSDDPADPAYNRPVRHPHVFSAEKMWRTDSRYDVVLVLGHNDAPPRAGGGSAIFLHLRGDGPTEGCVAVDRSAMAFLLGIVAPGSRLDIRRHLGEDAPLR
jgi:L,D-peptidoglycan transpeptidase YkuD (ErfK/YbiS/YcfS/YnhG family)